MLSFEKGISTLFVYPLREIEMKKTYSKPQAKFIAYQLSEGVASCNVVVIDMGGENYSLVNFDVYCEEGLFSNDVVCDGSIEDIVDDYCYQGASPEMNVFTS